MTRPLTGTPSKAKTTIDPVPPKCNKNVCLQLIVMGAESSTLASKGYGYHVLKVSGNCELHILNPMVQVHENSPADEAGLVPFFDFIVAVEDDGFAMEGDSEVDSYSLSKALQVRENQHTLLRVYNSKTDSVRDVDIIPNRKWGAGPKSNGVSLIGMSEH